MRNNAYLESKVLAADPLELVQLLYQAALDAVRDARAHLARGDISARSAAISKAMSVLLELSASLDHQCGGSISRNLADLYGYMQKRLLDANLRQSDEPLAETLGLLSTLAEGWQGVMNQARQAQSSVSEPSPVPAESLPESSAWTSRFADDLAPAPRRHQWQL